MEKTEQKKRLYIKLLKTILWVYIILCFIIAGLNYGYAAKAPENAAKLINWVWLIYENWIKTAFIIAGAFLTVKIVSVSGRPSMRKRNLIGFVAAALAVHIAMPFLSGNYDAYFYAMPFPWTTTPLWLLDTGTSLYQSTLTALGQGGIVTALIFYLCVCAVVFIGTLLLGRRFQCSTVCLFNGFAAEVFEPAMPLVRKRVKIKPGTAKLFAVLRWVFLAIALFFFCFWALSLFGVIRNVNMDAVAKAESYKYLAGELLMTMFFWIAFFGRGYCQYCPLGTVLGLLSKLSGQRITTSNTKCIACGKCSAECPMGIDVKNKAVEGRDVKDIRCVGCGHCVDACPTKNLCYSTRFIDAKTKMSVKQTMK